MTKSIAILGSTGSIGRQTLSVADGLGLDVAVLTCGSNLELITAQCLKYRPQLAVMATQELAQKLRENLAGCSIEVDYGPKGLLRAAAWPQADTVITAVVGMMGLEPTLAAVRAGKRIGLANKETLVCAGELVMAEAERFGAQIIPVDSEHSAIFQCLMGCQSPNEVKRLILTCSGGAFYGKTRQELETAGKDEALLHPNWKMGPKITIDCATLLNKGLEYIEAMRLYRVPAEKVSVVIHRQSIIHSMVEFCDGAVMAQLGVPDMRIPIQFALTYPKRMESPAVDLDLLSCGPLTFAAADVERFPCLGLAIEAAKVGGTACAILNGANEEAVAAYLQDKIRFYDIPRAIDHALQTTEILQNPSLEEILQADRLARQAAKTVLKGD